MRLTIVALFAALVLATLGPVWGAESRPNAIDVRVDHLSSQTLLTSPATVLVDSERQVAARRLASLLFPGWLLSIVAPIVILAYFWRSGTAARLRDRIRRLPGGEIATRFRFGAALGLIVRLSAFLPEFYIYRLERMMSLSDQLLRAWMTEWLVNTLVIMAIVGAIVTVVLWLVDRTHQWYLYSTALVFVVCYGLVFVKPYIISPYYDRIAALSPASAGVVQSLEKQAKSDVPVVEEVRSRTHLGAAYVEGIGGSQRIVLGDVVPLVASTAELRYIVATQLGYIAAGDPFRIALLNALCVVLGAALAVAIADRIGFRRDDDPLARLALVASLIGVMYLIVLPFHNASMRRLAREDNTYALQLTGERAAAVRTVIRGADQGLHAVCPGVFETIFLAETDSPSARVAAINGVRPACPK